MPVHLRSITFDCADPPALAAFWAAVTGYPVGQANEFYADLSGDGAAGRGPNPTVGPGFMFIKVPEAKTAKNRVHFDLGTTDLEAEVGRILGLGAGLVGRYHEHGVRWATFTDPEGNEFCVGHHAAPG